ncbi:MAG: hypothetical protein KatS3mg111_2771 [Pirellulaceae bacterium]|nr:MAG: hypothetical protein KatS3mg111_2771 [Pirellulaceae bacterium]
MKHPSDQFDSGTGDTPLPGSPPAGDADSQTRTVAYQGRGEPAASHAVVDEDQPTIISDRPAAAPDEFFQSMPLGKLAASLEGRRLDHFIVERMIGGGGMGAVFRGRDERLNRTVAIKVVPAARRDAETLRRFRLEAQAAAKLDHPNIARVYYVGEADHWNYIVFEFIDGVNLRDLVAMHGPLSIDDAVYYTRQVAEALEHAHERGVVHRDIKPSNILITAGGIAKVVDMGLARHTAVDRSTADETASGVTLGTFDYISPEQARNPRDADVRSDLYSLGCTLFYMLTGNPPFPEGTALQKLLNHGSLPPPDPRAWREDISDQLYAIMMKLMAKQPADRYQRPIDLVNDLMLLAEVENLPRSQTPGTVLMAPTVAQRSLVEASLPWLMALAALLGTALWLQVQDISSRYQLPALNYERPTLGPGAAKVATTSSQPATVDRAAPTDEASAASSSQANGGDELLLPERPVGLQAVVVAAKEEEVQGGRWAASLDQALQALQVDSGLREIVVRGEVSLNRPMRLGGRRFVIRGEATKGATIRVRLPSQSGDGLAANALELASGQLLFENVHLMVDARQRAGDSVARWLRLAPGAQVTFRQCWVTLIDDPRRTKTATADWIAVPVAAESTARIEPDASAITRIGVERTVVRGYANLIRWQATADPGVQLEVNLRESLVALSGSLLKADQVVSSAAGAGVGEQAVAKLICQDATLYTRQPPLVLNFAGAPDPAFKITRLAQRCVFGAPMGSVYAVMEGVVPDNLFGPFDWLYLGGRENYYDSTIRGLCSCRDELGSEVFVFGFEESRADGWFTEENFQRSVPWKSPTSIEAVELSRATPADFELADKAEPVGFRPVNGT